MSKADENADTVVDEHGNQISQTDDDARKNMLEVAYYTQETVDIRRDLRALLETAADRAKISREVVLATMDKLESEGIGTVDLFLDLDKGDLKDIGMVRGLWMSADQLLQHKRRERKKSSKRKREPPVERNSLTPFQGKINEYLLSNGFAPNTVIALSPNEVFCVVCDTDFKLNKASGLLSVKRHVEGRNTKVSRHKNNIDRSDFANLFKRTPNTIITHANYNNLLNEEFEAHLLAESINNATDITPYMLESGEEYHGERIKRQKLDDGDRIIRQDINDLLRIRLELDIKVGKPHCYCFQEALVQATKKTKQFFVCKQLSCAFFKWADASTQVHTENQGELLLQDQNGMSSINNMTVINVEGSMEELQQLTNEQMQNNINVEKHEEEYSHETVADQSMYEQVDPSMKNETVQQ
jgi:hypothetical protein